MTQSLFDLSGHSVVVTGASRGIGFAIARNFLIQGASVLIGGVDAAETEQARQRLDQEFPGQPSRVAAIAGDVSDPLHAKALVDGAFNAFGRLDSVVCNAGIDIIKPAAEYAPDEWDRVLAINLKGAFLVAQSAAKRWIERRQRGGAVSFTSSIAGSVGVPTLAPYAASKGGINQLVRTLAVEWADHEIRVNGVAPGYVQNIMAGVTAHADPASEERIRRFTPLERRATVDEIAAPFVFLATREASYITGAILAVDGGYTAL
jgi:NAD(P)-dependent dehydrogenase (short-subunit alcohol dehydrogenase family)